MCIIKFFKYIEIYTNTYTGGTLIKTKWLKELQEMFILKVQAKCKGNNYHKTIKRSRSIFFIFYQVLYARSNVPQYLF